MSLQGHGVVKGVYPLGSTGKGFNVQLTDGSKYALWQNPAGVSVGEVIDFTYTEKQNGEYTNRTMDGKSIKSAGAGAPATTTTQPAARAQAPANKIGDDERQKLIVAQNSLTNATNLVIAYKAELNVKGDNITSTVKEVASVLAKAVMSGDFYADPAFPKAEEFDDELPN